jgi:FKBP-type peptidyl-prolyl cis-trans isomerase 2
MRVEKGSLVWLDYDALLDSGEQFDSSELSGLLPIRVGEWEMLPGLGKKLIGLQEGDERLIRLTPVEAFGEWDPEAVLTIRESQLAAGVRLEDGMLLQLETSSGHKAICRLSRLAEDRVALDFNSLLAGEALTILVQVRKVVPPKVDRVNRQGDASGLKGAENLGSAP